MKNYEVCAICPGKVHLIGEHSVVHGEPAIIATINRYAQVYARNTDQITIDAVNLGRKESYAVEEIRNFTTSMNKLWKKCYDKEEKDKFKEMRDFLKKDEINPIKAMVGKSLEQLHIKSGVDIRIDSEIPIGAGLGSSAALSVAIPKAISEVYSQNLSRYDINITAKEIEKFNHGTPSGGDNSTCCHGGIVWFQKPSTIKLLKEEIPYVLENFVLVKTGKIKQPTEETVERSTGRMVDIVGNLPPEYRDPRIKLLGKSTYEMRSALERKDFNVMKNLMNLAHKTLAELHISTDEMDTIHSRVKKIGGSAKLSGAGGPGSVMLCYYENKGKLVDLLKDLDYEPQEVELGVDGLRVKYFCDKSSG